MNQTQTQPQYLSVADAARTLGVAEETIRRLARRGELRAVRAGRRILIPTSALTELPEVAADPRLPLTAVAASPAPVRAVPATRRTPGRAPR